MSVMTSQITSKTIEEVISMSWIAHVWSVWKKITCLNWLDNKKIISAVLSKLQLHASRKSHYSDVIIGAMASQITCASIVYSTVGSDADQRILQSSAPLAIVKGIHRWLVNSPHKRPVTQKIFSFADVITWNYWFDKHPRANSTPWYFITC